MAVITTPIAAEQAREVLIDARVATLRTASATTGSMASTVALGDVGDGVPRLVLAPDSPAVPGLAGCRVAALTVTEPTSGRRVRIVASYRMARPDEAGRRTYEATILSVRLDGGSGVSGTVTIPVDEFLRVSPDPRLVRRGAMIAHLEAEHGEGLAARVRELGHDCEAVLVDPAPELGIVLQFLGREGAGRLSLSDAGDSGRPGTSGDLSLASVCRCPTPG
ncbi:hypothetical protein BH09ACT12_BH09ACT12_37950 [soil metagenome]